MFLRNERKRNESCTSPTCSPQTLKTALCLAEEWQTVSCNGSCWSCTDKCKVSPLIFCQQLAKSSVRAPSWGCELGHCYWKKQAKSVRRLCPDCRCYLCVGQGHLCLWEGLVSLLSTGSCLWKCQSLVALIQLLAHSWPKDQINHVPFLFIFTSWAKKGCPFTFSSS